MFRSDSAKEKPARKSCSSGGLVLLWSNGGGRLACAIGGEEHALGQRFFHGKWDALARRWPRRHVLPKAAQLPVNHKKKLQRRDAPYHDLS
mmetsp:Transcript_24253/g.59151  ORF Transcript_24253/g.59151 Transcript_24253/m.59151 type:complete len:91 (+) Transcript_24253:198-470(+)